MWSKNFMDAIDFNDNDISTTAKDTKMTFSNNVPHMPWIEL